ncbi:hypothetical protein [Bradyrhizobium pachyrhizi]|uniref:hypothetical protein n=1 Tax=Bradyrhizobium pachyrhizi TaxID=280333 RepID=UPI00067C535F|nr:hypothetical protein [Bradyrhizobium pachyrhizi]
MQGKFSNLSSTLLRWAALLVIAIFWLLFVPAARAGDYAVAYALDVGGRQETGIVDKCNTEATCNIEFKTQLISIKLSFFERDKKVKIAIHGARPGCCFFYGGTTSVSRDAGSLVGLTVYEGHQRRGNEFVVNFHIGTLFLRFAQAD